MKLAKSITGAIHIKYECPHCKGSLTSKAEEIGHQDVCPDCNKAFVVPGAALYAQYQAQEVAKAKAKEEERATKEAYKEAEAEARRQEAQEQSAHFRQLENLQRAQGKRADLEDLFARSVAQPHKYPALNIVSDIYNILAIVTLVLGGFVLIACVGTALMKMADDLNAALISLGFALIVALYTLVLWAVLKMVPELLSIMQRLERNTQVTAAASLQMIEPKP